MNQLPSEILCKIFQHARSLDAYNAALVCKAWVTPAQSALFSCISFNCESRLEEFYNVIKRSPQLGNKVKALSIQFRIQPFNENYKNDGIRVSSLLSNLLPLLYNLERFHDLNTFSYVSLFKALSNSYLKRLKKIQSPELRGLDDYLNYLKCALLMKDRLECIYLTNDIFRETPLGSELHQFKNLVDVVISLKTDDEIDVFERCRDVKKIAFKFDPLGRLEVESTPQFTVRAISNYVPNVAVKSLSGKLGDHNHFKVIKYIMHKFPQLNRLHLHFDTSKPAQFDLSVVTELLTYVFRIDTFTIRGLLLDQANILRTIGHVWHTVSFGSENLKICYCNDRSEGTKITLNIEKSNPNQATLTSLSYNGVDFEWQIYINFIQESGKYITDLEFECISYFPLSFLDMLYLPSDFVPHTFVNCTNLQYLRMERCVLNTIFYTGANFSKKLSLRKLSLCRCTIYDGVLEQMSQYLHHIDCLKIYHIKFLRTHDQSPNTVHNIIMPHTNINTVMLRGYSRNDTLYIRVVSIGENSCCYYRFDLVNYNHAYSSELEYNTSNSDMHINIQCRTSPTIEI